MPEREKESERERPREREREDQKAFDSEASSRAVFFQPLSRLPLVINESIHPIVCVFHGVFSGGRVTRFDVLRRGA